GRANVELDNLTLFKAGPPAHFHTVLSASGVLDELVVDGTANPDLESPSIQATIEGHGIRAGALAAYLPPGIELATKDGRVRASIDAGISRNPQGGNSARLLVQNVDWRDGEGGDPLLAWDSMRLVAP